MDSDIKYLITDDTLDVGKEPLPLDEKSRKIHEDIMSHRDEILKTAQCK